MLNVTYDPRCLAPVTSYSPSSAKPALVMADWEAHGIPVKMHPVTPATGADLYQAHDVDYVRGVMNLEVDNGFGNTSPLVRDSLPWTVGAMSSAALMATWLKRPVCAPVSGFHHAGYDFGGGYCTFNGLVVAAVLALRSGRCDQVVILDFDHHFGNGTHDSLTRLSSKDRACIKHFTVGRKLFGPSDGAACMSYLRNSLDTIVNQGSNRTLVLYQAGADLHIDDPLGGVLTTEQMLERDRLVFSTCKDNGMAIAWNLAGGYQKDSSGGIPVVLELHRNTAKASLE